MTEPTRSPFNDRPLRVPGRPLMQGRAAIWDDSLELWAFTALAKFLRR